LGWLTLPARLHYPINVQEPFVQLALRRWNLDLGDNPSEHDVPNEAEAIQLVQIAEALENDKTLVDIVLRAVDVNSSLVRDETAGLYNSANAVAPGGKVLQESLLFPLLVAAVRRGAVTNNIVRYAAQQLVGVHETLAESRFMAVICMLREFFLTVRTPIRIFFLNNTVAAEPPLRCRHARHHPGHAPSVLCLALAVLVARRPDHKVLREPAAAAAGRTQAQRRRKVLELPRAPPSPHAQVVRYFFPVFVLVNSCDAATTTRSSLSTQTQHKDWPCASSFARRRLRTSCPRRTLSSSVDSSTVTEKGILRSNVFFCSRFQHAPERGRRKHPELVANGRHHRPVLFRPHHGDCPSCLVSKAPVQPVSNLSPSLATKATRASSPRGCRIPSRQSRRRSRTTSTRTGSSSRPSRLPN